MLVRELARAVALELADARELGAVLLALALAASLALGGAAALGDGVATRAFLAKARVPAALPTHDGARAVLSLARVSPRLLQRLGILLQTLVLLAHRTREDVAVHRQQLLIVVVRAATLRKDDSHG